MSGVLQRKPPKLVAVALPTRGKLREGSGLAPCYGRVLRSQPSTNRAMSVLFDSSISM